MSYFDLTQQINTDLLSKHITASIASGQGFHIESFLVQFSQKVSKENTKSGINLTQMRPNDQIEILKQSLNFMAQAYLQQAKSTQSKLETLQNEKLVAVRKNKDIMRERDDMLTALNKSKQKVDFQGVIDINHKVVKLQAFFRMVNIRNVLKKKREELRMKHKKVDPKKELIDEFMKCLKVRSLVPEEFFRVIDVKQNGKVPVEHFIEKVLERGLLATRQQATRLAFLIDEDVSDDITLHEISTTLTAFGFPPEETALVTSDQGILTYEQQSLIRVYDSIKRRSIEPHELFNAIDIDGNQQLSIQEIKDFICTLVNGSQGDTQNLLDKDLRIFMNFMDVDKSETISKGEFLRQYQKLEGIVTKQYPLYKKFISQQRKRDIPIEELPKSEQDARNTIKKMQEEGLDLKQFLNHLQTLVDPPNSRLIKLGPILKQFQLSYPTLSVEEIRSLLKWVKVQGGGKYDYLEIQLFTSRLSDSDSTTIPLYQTLKVITDTLRQRQVLPDDLIKRTFYDKSQTIGYETFTAMLQGIFQLPLDSVTDLYNTLLVDHGQSEVYKDDLVEVLNSFYDDDDSSQASVNIRNLASQLKLQDQTGPKALRIKRLKLVDIVLTKLREKKIQPLSIFKMAQAQPGASTNGVTKVAIQNAFGKMLPSIGRDVIGEIWSQDKYMTKEQYLIECEGLEELKAYEEELKSSKSVTKEDLIKKLDDALLGAKVSPSVLFREADRDGDSTIQVKELYEVLLHLGIKMDELTLQKIFKEIDQNGNGEIEEREFYALFKKSRNNNQNLKPTAAVVEDQVSRDLLLPTKRNLRAMQRGAPMSIVKNERIEYSSEIQTVFDEIEAYIPLKEALGSVKIDHKLNVDLKEVAGLLKNKGVQLSTLVRLLKILDSQYLGVASLPQLLILLESHKQGGQFLQVDQNLISKIIQSSLCITVSDYFSKHSPPLAQPKSPLNKRTLEKEFSRLFQLSPQVASQIFESIRVKYGFGLDGLQNQHLHTFLQQIYEQVYPQDRALVQLAHAAQQQKSIHQSNVVQGSKIQEKQPLVDSVGKRREDVKKVFVKLLGNENGAVSLAGIFEKKYAGQSNVDIGFEEIFKSLVEEMRILTLGEAKSLFNLIIEGTGQGDTSKKQISVMEFTHLIQKMEDQLVVSQVKEVTKRMELASGGDLFSMIVPKVSFVQDGVISKFSLTQSLLQQFCTQNKKVVIEPSEVRFVLNFIDSENAKVIKGEQLQQYFKLYTSVKQISMKLYFMYFAFILDMSSQTSTSKSVVPYIQDSTKAKTHKLPPQKEFASLLFQHFPSLTKEEYLLDLYDFMADKISPESNEAVLSYFYSQVDQYRDIADKFKTRDNKDLTQLVVSELARLKPNFPLYKIMDDLPFIDECSIVPALSLKNHMRKLYPYADEGKLQTFMTLVDINGDQRIEVQEMFQFFQEIDNGVIQASKVLYNIAQIVVSTNESLEGFIKLHNINVDSLDNNINFGKFADFLTKLFRLTKYESYLVYLHFKPKPSKSSTTIAFDDFLISVTSQMKDFQLQTEERSQQNNLAEANIQTYKIQAAEKLQAKIDLTEELNKYEEQKSMSSSPTNVLKRIEVKKAVNTLTNVEILRLFIDNFKEICTVQQIKQACLKLKELKRASPQLRVKLFTRRACMVEDVYRELTREDPKIEYTGGITKASITLTESEKVLLSVLPLQQVDMTFDCNIFRLKQMIDKIKPTSVLDYQMLHSLLAQRETQIKEMLEQEFISFDSVIDKIKTHATKKVELLVKEEQTFDQFINLLHKAYPNLVLKPKDIEILSKQIGTDQLTFGKAKLFLAQCGVKSRVQDTFPQVFDTLEEAQSGMQLIKKYLNENPYIDINQDLVPPTTLVQWSIIEHFDESLGEKLSPIHLSRPLVDCMTQLYADQGEIKDHLAKMILHTDDNTVNQPFMIMKVDQQCVVCDRSLPMIENESGVTAIGFSFDPKHHALPFVEKALAVHQGGYHKFKTMKSITRMFQLLNSEQLEAYPLKPTLEALRESYQDILVNHFQPSVMRHLYFQMPFKKRQSPLLNGLEPLRVYAIIGFICIKSESGKTGIPHQLAIIHNPYTEEDQRKGGEMWSKMFLKNNKKNQKFIDLIVQSFGQEAYLMITDDSSHFYLYDFVDIFEMTGETTTQPINIYQYFKLSPKIDMDFIFTRHPIIFDANTNKYQITLKGPPKPQQVESKKAPTSVFAQIQVDLDEDCVSTYQIFSELRTTLFSKEVNGRKFVKTLAVPYGETLIVMLDIAKKVIHPDYPEESFDMVFICKKDERVEVKIEKALTEVDILAKLELLEKSKKELAVKQKELEASISAKQSVEKESAPPIKKEEVKKLPEEVAKQAVDGNQSEIGTKPEEVQKVETKSKEVVKTVVEVKKQEPVMKPIEVIQPVTKAKEVNKPRPEQQNLEVKPEEVQKSVMKAKDEVKKDAEIKQPEIVQKPMNVQKTIIKAKEQVKQQDLKVKEEVKQPITLPMPPKSDPKKEDVEEELDETQEIDIIGQKIQEQEEEYYDEEFDDNEDEVKK